MSKQLFFLVVCFFSHFLMAQNDEISTPSRLKLSTATSSPAKREDAKPASVDPKAEERAVEPKISVAKTTDTKPTTETKSATTPSPAKTTDTKPTTSTSPAKTTETKPTTSTSPAKTTETKPATTPSPAKTTETKPATTPSPAKTAETKPATTPSPAKSKAKVAEEKQEESYVSLWELGWKAEKVVVEPTIAEYFVFKNGENFSNFTEMAGVTTYREFFAKNVEQIQQEMTEDMKKKYGKAKYTEVDKNVYGDNSYIIFMIETENYDNSGKPQSIIQHIIKGTEYVHTCYYISKTDKMPAAEKRKWTTFFKKATLQKVLPSAYLSTVGISK